MGSVEETPPNGGNERVTLRSLNDRLALESERQRVEHIKTRALVAVLALPSLGRVLPYVLGAIGVPHGWVPW